MRLLHRLSCNPNCLQALLRTGAAALIQHHLCLGVEGPGRAEQRQSVRVKSKVRQLGEKMFSVLMLWFECTADSAPVFTLSTGFSLLSNLRVQCETAFGAGVLSHVMLSGSDTERINCALSLPLVSR